MIAILMLYASALQAQTSASSHTVEIRVMPIAQFGATLATSSTKTGLNWSTNGERLKVSAECDLPDVLQLEVKNLRGGYAASNRLKLTNVSCDLLHILRSQEGGCELVYMLADAATAPNEAQITYTLTEQ